MNKKYVIPALISLMAFSLLGIVAAQVYWINETYWLTQRQVDHEIQSAMQSAIVKVEEEANNRFIAADLGIELGPGVQFANKKDSLFKLKFMLDSLELAVTEAELNHRLGIKEDKAPIAVEPATPKTVAKKILKAVPSAPPSTPIVKEIIPAPEFDFSFSNRFGVEPVERPLAPEAPSHPTAYPKRSRAHRNYTQDAYTATVSSAAHRAGYASSGQQAGFSFASTTDEQLAKRLKLTTNNQSVFIEGNPVTDGQIIVLPNGRKVKIEIEPYLKTRVGVRNGQNIYFNTVEQVDLSNLKGQVIDLSRLQNLPSLWLHQMDSLVSSLDGQLNNRFRFRRPEGAPRFPIEEAEMAYSRSNVVNRSIRSFGSRQRELMRYVDSLSRRQIEFAFSVARKQDSLDRSRSGFIAPDLALANDVSGVSMTNCADPTKVCKPELDQTKTKKGKSSNAVQTTAFVAKQASHASKSSNSRVSYYPVVPQVQNESQALNKALSGINKVNSSLDKLIRRAALQEEHHKLIDTMILAKALREEFKLRNLDIDFDFCVINTNAQEPTAIFASVAYIGANEPNTYKASLFPSDPNSGYFLSLLVPNKSDYALLNLKWSMVMSAVFLLMIVGVFTAGIMTIIRQKRLSVMKSDFISNMTHELKTPLATISLASDTINNNMVLQDPDRIKYFTGIIKEENQRMNGHIERVLQMALLDKGEFKLKKQEWNLTELVLEQGERMCLAVSSKGGHLDVDFEEDDLPIFADKLQVQSLLSNLLDNAIKYCERIPEISISLKKDGDYALLSVKDNGIGISAKAQKRIFDRFYRVTQGNLHEVKGFGLGLSYVKAIVEAHEGSVEVSSVPKEGSEFVIRLPLIKSVG